MRYLSTRALFFALLTAPFGVILGQTTFNVDMSCMDAHGGTSSFSEVFVTGPWCGWCASEGYNLLSDEDGDGVYTLELPSVGVDTLIYMYAIDGFSDLENLVDDVVDGGDCAPVTDYANYANRQIVNGGISNDVFGHCSSCPIEHGCTDSNACNYDAGAGGDDGSCEYVSCTGCTDPTACNYDDTATLDGSCDYSCIGCTDPSATNYNPDATISFNEECDYSGPPGQVGCTDSNACNYDAGAGGDDGSCEYVSCAGCTDLTACNYDDTATLNDGACDYSCVGCTDPSATNYNPNATISFNEECDYKVDLQDRSVAPTQMHVTMMLGRVVTMVLANTCLVLVAQILSLATTTIQPR